MKINCGFDKWSIAYNKENRSLDIEMYQYPLEGKLSLYDASDEELLAIAKMLIETVREKNNNFEALLI
jgi:hypothetical protein